MRGLKAPPRKIFAPLAFTALAGQTYTLQYRDQAAFGNWQTLTQFAARPADTSVGILIPLSAPQRFYRLSTP